MTDPTIDKMSRELGTARRWATRMAERVWQLEDAIRTHRDELSGDRDATPFTCDDRLWQHLDEDGT